MVKPTPSNTKEVTIEQKLQNIANKNQAVLLTFVNSYVPMQYSPTTFGHAQIGLFEEFIVEDKLEEIAEQTKIKKAFILINSYGGGLGSSFKIARAIRNAFDDITIFVPHIAASGGTLLALTGNKIMMGVMSQLSPLDPQIRYKNEQVSVNSIFTAKNKLDNALSKTSEKDIPYSIKHLADQLDPIIIEQFAGIQKEGADYLTKILEKTIDDATTREKIIAYFTTKLPTHHYVIDYDSAKENGLNVEDGASDKELWSTMRHWLKLYIAKESDRHSVDYYIPQSK